MNLAVDIGNTRAKLGLFDSDELSDVTTVNEFNTDILNEFIEANVIQHVIISSVRNLNWTEDDVRADGHCIILNHQTPLPIKLAYQTPETLGLDRIAGCTGAWSEFKGKNVFVVDAGTCVTYDLITAEGEFRGGNIAPGLDMRLSAMHHFTQKLPSVKRKAPETVLGRSTSEAMQNGAEMGILLEIEGYKAGLSAQYDTLTTVLTGGDAPYLAETLKTEIFVRPNLVLTGLNEILVHNVAS